MQPAGITYMLVKVLALPFRVKLRVLRAQESPAVVCPGISAPRYRAKDGRRRSEFRKVGLGGVAFVWVDEVDKVLAEHQGCLLGVGSAVEPACQSVYFGCLRQ